MDFFTLQTLQDWLNDSRLGRWTRQLRRPRYPLLRNVLNGVERSGSKRALLLDIVPPFLDRSGGGRLPSHQNKRQAPQIAAALAERGYLVDVADVRASDGLPVGPYDLVLSGHSVPRPPVIGLDGAVRLYLATTAGYRAHNRGLRQRQALMQERRGQTVRLRRVYGEQAPYVAGADAILGFGNQTVLETWTEHSTAPLLPFNNYGFRELSVEVSPRPALTSKSFLYFASASQLQKGLDLLLEIFPKYPDLHLFVASSFKRERDFCSIYRRELFSTENVHPLGWIDVNTSAFRDLLERCGSVILPSCSEGQPGSVVQCMHAGLVPLVTKQAGIDTEDFGMTFPDDRLETIEQGILEVARAPQRWHRAHGVATRQVALDRYSEQAFAARWREMLALVLDGPLPAPRPVAAGEPWPDSGAP